MEFFVRRPGRLVKRSGSEVASVHETVIRHIEADLANPQCSLTIRDIHDGIRSRTLRIWCCDPRGRTPRFCILGASASALLRIAYAFIACLQVVDRLGSIILIERYFDDLYGFYRSLVLPCTHTDEQAVSVGTDTGCGYLMALRTHTVDYAVPTTSFVQRLLGSRSQSDGYEVVRGSRQAAVGALVIRGNTLIPMITPRHETEKFFVWHPQVEDALIDYVIWPVCRYLKIVTRREAQVSVVRSAVASLTQRHIAVTLQKLAQNKPVLHCTVSQRGVQVRIS